MRKSILNTEKYNAHFISSLPAPLPSPPFCKRGSLSVDLSDSYSTSQSLIHNP